MNTKVPARTDQSSTSGHMTISTNVSRTSTGQFVPIARVIRSARGPRSLSDEDVEKAVYAHIKAVRALGRETANTLEIARALSIPLRRVEEAAKRLEPKGVRHAR